jgi:hypothetical protein
MTPMTPMTAQQHPLRLSTDDRMAHRGRHLTTTFMLEVGDVAYLIDIVDGRLHAVRPGRFAAASWQFALRAPANEWAAFWRARPEPGHNDIMAMQKRKVLSMEGDLRPLMANLRYFKELLASVREAAP